LIQTDRVAAGVTFITDFGDPGVLLPVATAVFTLLLLLGQRRIAMAWLLMLATGFGLILALKLTFASCVPPSLLAEIHTPSGHTASATLIYGGLIALLGGGLSLTLVASFGFATLIGTSRLFLHLHSAAETAIGGAVGMLGITLFAAALPGVSVVDSRPRHLVILPIIGVSLALALHGVHWPLEPTIRHVSHHYWPFPACRTPAQHHGQQES
jgi:membrane-associated phospholipid phosphatase